MGYSARSAFLAGVFALVLAPAAASAQPVPPPGGGAPTPAPAAGGGGAAPAASGGGGAAPAPAGSGGAAADKPGASSNLGGFSFNDKPQKRAASRGVVRRVSGPIATLPGFEQTGDGGTRFFVQLTQQVPVEERKAQGSITYVLKGAHVNKYNNTNALVTVHFNTPVSRARLVPQGNDLLFVLDLRAAATPTFKMTDAPDKTAMLTVDFPKGDFVAPPPSGDTPPVAAESNNQNGDENTEKAPKPPPGKKSGKKRAQPAPGPKP